MSHVPTTYSHLSTVNEELILACHPISRATSLLQDLHRLYVKFSDILAPGKWARGELQGMSRSMRALLRKLLYDIS